MEGGPLMLAGANRAGLVKFSRGDDTAGVQRAWLSFSALYGTVFTQQITVYAYGSASGDLSAIDVWRLNGEPPYPQLLGTLQLGPVEAGQEVFVDVTGFVQTASSPYLAFALQSDDVLLLSSQEANHGHASQLILASVPEPGEAALMFAGLLTLAGWLRRRRA